MTTSPVPAPAAEFTNGKHLCRCSDDCSALTGRTFAQGHDARLVTRLRNQAVDPAHPMTAAEALGELQRRGGLDGLYFKLERAIDNAAAKAAELAKRKADRAAAKAGGRAPRKARKLETFELGEFCLAAMPIASSPRVVAKVGRWAYRGEILTYQIVEDGRVSKGDQVDVFEYSDKRGERQQALSFTRLRVDEEFKAAAPAADGAEVPQVAVAPVPTLTPAPAEAEASEQFADIPF